MQRIEHTNSSQPLTLRRFYQNYGSYYPPPGWQLYGPDIVVWGAAGLCVAGYGFHVYSRYRYTTAGDRQPIDFVEANFVNSRENLGKGRWWTLITSSFMHFEPIHLACNVLTLVAFRHAAHIYGPSGFVGLWLGSAVACGAAQIMWEMVQDQELKKRKKDRITIFGHPLVQDDPARSTIFAKSIGASGSVLGVVTAWCCMNPSTRIGMFLIPLYVPAWSYGVAFVTFSGYCLVTNSLPALGHAGHLGGMAFGAAYYYLWLRRRVRIRYF